MKKRVVFAGIFLLVLIIFFLSFKIGGITGDYANEELIGPSLEEQKCMEDCLAVGCEQGDDDCVESNQEKCMSECGSGPPSDLGEGEQCVQDCIDKTCVVGPDYSNCMEQSREECDKQCGMIGEPEAQGEEEQCIRDCINKIDPTITCSSGTFEGEGETGNVICQECAKSCEHLYSGPCLSDEEWTKKENECTSQCEHCYGEPIKGPSGQGYECTIDIKCSDASSEFGDDSGTGDDSYEEGHEEPGVITEFFESVGDFFKGIFGGNG